MNPQPPLQQPVTVLAGVGAERAVLLGRLGIRTVEDLLLHAPRRYEDRRRFIGIGDLALGETAAVRARIVARGVKRWKQGRRSVFECVLEDGTGRLHCRWWDQPYLENRYRIGDEWLVFGRLTQLKPRAVDHPETEPVGADQETLIHLNRWVPVYPLTEGLGQRTLRGWVWHTLERFESQIPEPWPGPPTISLPARPVAIRFLHFPSSMAEAAQARERLAYDELVALQGEIQRRRRRLRQRGGSPGCAGDNRLIRPFLRRLSFSLTDAQTTVLREVRQDMRGPAPMRRLLQGDVGSGKTVVAACAALMAIESGYSVALMAPTEVLAQQHFHRFRDWLDSLQLSPRLLTGGNPESGTGLEPSGAGRATTAPPLVIGTHALLHGRYQPERLGLVIIDEQHKFGVAQRLALLRKGPQAHLLVMTATPIPRTLGLTLYGDLDISTLESGPHGRREIRTFVRNTNALPKVWSFVREQLAQGHQAFVVYPRLEDPGERGWKTLVGEFQRVQEILRPHSAELVHGNLSADEKDRVLEDFRQGRISVLLATSVVEVGVDVPNATVMVIEGAEQFGLAQLHQMRGRVGRGVAQAYCILVAGTDNPEARERLRVLETVQDGFRIAEEDLKSRGPGEFLGEAQSGRPSFRFVDLSRDWALARVARDFAVAKWGQPETSSALSTGRTPR